MSVKSEISNAYLNIQLDEHGRKPYPSEYCAVITGTANEGSIGRAIYDHLRNANVKCYAFHGDVRKESDIFDIANLGTRPANVLIMSHGVTHLDWFENCPLEKMKEMIDVNLTGSAMVAQSFVKSTIIEPYRKIIIGIGSMAYNKVLNGSALYCASKAGHAHLMKCLAWELAPKGYDVYCINPSNTAETPMAEQTIEGLMRYRFMEREEAEAYWNDTVIRGDMLRAEEIANLIFTLIHGTPYLSGAMLDLGGGQR